MKTASEKTLKLAFLSSYTIKNIEPIIETNLKDSDFNSVLFFGEYNQYAQEILNTESALHRFKPDIIVLALDPETFFEKSAYKSMDENEATFNEKYELLETLVEHSMQSLHAKVLITNVAHPVYSPLSSTDLKTEKGLTFLTNTFNNKLITLAQKQENCFILNYIKILQKLGSNAIDKRLYSMGKIYLSKPACNALSAQIMQYVNSFYGKTKKCLVVDLDNTLWGGVIGEDGIEGIQLGGAFPGNVYREVQKILLNYNKSGTILAISSKNNEEDVLPVFKERKMILKKKHFGCMKINWENKVKNIQEIANHLNIGLDSIVFLDDNPAERELVKAMLPQVTVLEFPEDIIDLPELLQEMPYFHKHIITESDTKKAEQYFLQNKRIEHKKAFNSLGDYLKNLSIKMSVKKDDISNCERITQLINKTNQFNLRTQRYSSEEVKQYMTSRTYNVFSVSASDKFGDFGTVGVIIIKQESENVWFIDTFLLSCRVMSRDIEKQFIIEVMKSLPTGSQLLGEYIPTLKNKPVESLYESLGFNKTDDKRYKLSTIQDDVSFIEVQE